MVISSADAAGMPANDPIGAVDAPRERTSQRLAAGKIIAPPSRRFQVAGTHATGLIHDEASRLRSALVPAAPASPLRSYRDVMPRPTVVVLPHTLWYL